MNVSEPRRAWLVVFLLFLFMLINFGDKAILGLAAVPIMRELALSPSEFGLLGSSFFFLFAISAVCSGFLVNRAGTRWPILVMALLWSVAQVPMIVPVGFAALMSFRILLGAAEGPAYPTAVHATFNWFADAKRALPTLVLALGSITGLLAAPALTYLIVHFSWHVAFAILGLLSCLWAGIWFLFGYEAPAPPKIPLYAERQLERISYLRLLATPTTIATIICGYVAYSGLSLLLVWFTPYLSQALGYSMEAAGWLSALPPAGMIVVMTAAAWASERAVLGGVATRRARGLLTAFGVMLGGIAICLIPFCPLSGLKVAMMVLGVALPSAIYVFGHPIVSEFTPPAQRAAVLSITNAGITLAGIAAPYTMGRLIEGGSSVAAGYERGFLVCGIATVIGGMIGAYFLRPQAELLRLSRGAATR
jgi:ACS family D-galactonate transporter-like MFS transporter